MLFYTTVMTILNVVAFVLCIQPMIEQLKAGTPGATVKVGLIAVAFILNAVIFVAILNFLRFHLGLIVDNYTTL